MSKTRIEWCDETVNFFTGCSGPEGGRCPWCYARKMANRLAYIPGTVYGRVLMTTAESDYDAGVLCNLGDPFAPALHLDVLDKAQTRLMRSGKRRIFLGSMADICSSGEWLRFGNGPKPIGRNTTTSVQEIVRDFCVKLPFHTFLILTKRPSELLKEWPANVHLGISASSLKDLIVRGSDLSMRNCGVRWLSLEPWDDETSSNEMNDALFAVQPGWVVVGGWSGAKPLRPGVIASAERIVEACADMEIPCFVKDNIRKLNMVNLGRPPMDWPKEIPT